MARKRDYKAEYQRRNALAKERGFASYNKQRRAIETGRIPSLQPQRLRSKKTIDKQVESYGIFGTKPIKDFRIEAGQAWSDRNARTATLKFDAERAKKDEAYLSAYLGATIMQEGKVNEPSNVIPSDDLHILLVDILGVVTDEEYDNRYGDM